MKRPGMPTISVTGQQALEQYTTYLRQEQDASPATLRNYLSDLRQFAAWCEKSWEEGSEQEVFFTPVAVTTPTITRYRAYLQTHAKLKPASVNRSLVSIKRYFAWVTEREPLPRDPSKPVKLVAHETRPPRHLTDRQEEALVAAVTAGSNKRDRTLLVLMLHTGLRAREACTVKRSTFSWGNEAAHSRSGGRATNTARFL